MPSITFSPDFVLDVMQSAPVREALRARAEQIAERADAEYERIGSDARTTVTEGTRPKGRPYARVSSPAVDSEWGTWRVPKRRVLARAAGFRVSVPAGRKKAAKRKLSKAEWRARWAASQGRKP